MSSLSRGLLFGALCAAVMPAQSAGVPGQGTWETTLQAGDLNGDSIVDAYYDTAVNITWLKNWTTNGLLSWTAASAWAAGLNVHGVTGWRLPSISDTGSPGCDFSFAGGTDCGYNVDPASSEMAHMFYVTLGSKSWCPPGDATCAGGPQPGWGLTNTALFAGLSFGGYWFGQEYLSDPGAKWAFHMGYGDQDGYNTGVGTGGSYAVAVHPGDVAAVPEPQVWALLLLGLGAGAVARKRWPR